MGAMLIANLYLPYSSGEEAVPIDESLFEDLEDLDIGEDDDGELDD